MKKTMKRMLSIMLAVVMVLGLAPIVTKSVALADGEIEIKSGKTVTADISDTLPKVTYKLVVPKTSKMSFTISSELSDEVAISLRRGTYFEAVGPDRITVKNGQTKDVIAYGPADIYFLTVSRVASNDKGSVKVKCKVEAVDQINDKEPNSSIEQAMPIENLKSGNFVGTLTHDDLEDYYKVDIKEKQFFTFSVSAMTEDIVNISFFYLDPATNNTKNIPGLNDKQVSKGVNLKETETFSTQLEPGTYYIRINSSVMNQYRFKTDYVETQIDKIVLKKKKVTLKLGKKANLFKSVTPKDANGNLTAESSDPNKVEIVNARKGIVKGAKVGKSTVTFTYGDGKKVSCVVTVKK